MDDLISRGKLLAEIEEMNIASLNDTLNMMD